MEIELSDSELTDEADFCRSWVSHLEVWPISENFIHREQEQSVPGAWPTQEVDISPHLVYQYQPLLPGQWIRLFRLECGQTGDPLQFSIYPMLLEDAIGQYDALSYEWGPPHPSFTVLVDGLCMRLRKSLFEFLLTLRSEKEPRILWADAICIDQQRIVERNHQVQQMRSIYRHSRITRVWLGVLDKASKFLRWSPSKWPSVFPTDSTIRVIRSGLAEILSASYWTRLWIIQEIILSREVEVYVSKRSFSWIEFVRLCKQGAGELGPNNGLVEKLSSSTMLTLHRQRVDPTERSLHDLVQRYRECLCFDVRDRIFGLLGLVENFSFDVDYNLSRLELFERVMHAQPVRFAEDFGEQLALALELSPQDVGSTTMKQLPCSIPMRVCECGSVTLHASKLRWDKFPNQVCIPVSYLEDAIVEGDSLYSASATPQAAVRGRPRFLIVLRQQRGFVGSECQSLGSKSIAYDVVGFVLALHPFDEVPDSSVYSSNRLLLDARVYRNPVLDGYGFGPITMDIQIPDFLTLGITYGFRHSDQIPRYDGLTEKPFLQRMSPQRKPEDEDGNESAETLSVMHYVRKAGFVNG